MRAVVVEEFGGPEVLHLADMPEPQPGPGQVAIDVAYAGVNFAELMARASGYRGAELPLVPGLEVSGRVRALGPGVDGVEPGQPVAAFTNTGGYAEVALAAAELTFALPDGLDLRTAAALPTIVPTAHALVHEIGRIQPGESVLVHAAAGGVGTVVGQMAKRAGASPLVGVVSRAEKQDYPRGFGYDDVLLYADFDDRIRDVDVVFDPNGGETWRRSFAVLAPYGRIVGFGNAEGDPWTADFATLAPVGATVSAFSIGMFSASRPDVLRALAERSFRLVAAGEVQVPITDEFALDDAAQAHRLMESRTSMGKLLLKVS